MAHGAHPPGFAILCEVYRGGKKARYVAAYEYHVRM